MRGRVVAVLAVVSMALAASCGGDDDASDSESAVSAGGAGATTAPTSAGGSGDTGGSTPSGDDGDECTPERAGGDLSVMTGFAVHGFDATMLEGSGARGGDVAAAFYGTVIRYDDATGEYHPAIAESWDSNEDHTEWTVTLRDDVTFGNGDPFTTHDIVAHWERMGESAMAAGAMARLVSDVEIVNDYEMAVSLEAPYDLRYVLSSETGWVPNRKIVEQRGDAFHANPKGAGAGAFEFASMSAAPGESLVLTAKDDWWGGPVCLDRIEFTYAEEVSTQTDAFLNGEVDTLFIGDQEQAAEIDDEGLLVHETPVGTMGVVYLNLFDESTPFHDVRIREAMQLAVDYDILHQRLFDGRGPKPSSALVPEEFEVQSGVEGPAYDPERARELVQETIDEGVWDGSFTYLHSPIETQTEVAVALKGMWESVGMTVTLDPAEDAATRLIVDRNFEVASLGLGIAPPDLWRALAAMECDSGRNRSGFCDPEMDEGLAAMRGAVTMEDKSDALAQIQKVWNRTFPAIPYRHGVFGYAAHPDVHGLEFGVDYTPHFEDAWVEQ